MTTREIFREIGVILIGFMIYESIYGPWSPEIARHFPGIDTSENFTLSRAIAILLVCASIFAVFWAYDVAFRIKQSRADMFADGVDKTVEMYGMFTGFVVNSMRIASLYSLLQYLVSIAILSVFSWLALGARQAFCVFLGTLFILDTRKIWGSRIEEPA